MAGKKRGSASTAVKNLDLVQLKHFIQESSYTYTSLSTEMGYDASYVSGVLSGKLPIPITAYKLMCCLLGVKEDRFIKKSNTVDTPSTDSTVDSAQLVAITKELSELSKAVVTLTLTLNKTLEDIGKVMNAQTIIQTKSAEDIHKLLESATKNSEKPVEPKPQAFAIKR